MQGGAELRMEIEVLSRLRHPHIVLLMGHSPEERCIVYEFMSGGSLKSRLLKSGAFGEEHLFWVDRLRIASEVASAILYMHQHEPPILHRDLKPSNVLLDANLISKISDVGLARALPGNGGQGCVRTGIKGTIGYIDPDQMITGVTSEKSDIFALGLVLLQLLTGICTIGEVHDLLDACIVGGAMNLARAAELFMSQLDESAGMWSMELAEMVVVLALRCVDRKPVERPDLNREIQPMLSRVAKEAIENFAHQMPATVRVGSSTSIEMSSRQSIPRQTTFGGKGIAATERRSSTGVVRDIPRPQRTRTDESKTPKTSILRSVSKSPYSGSRRSEDSGAVSEVESDAGSVKASQGRTVSVSASKSLKESSSGKRGIFNLKKLEISVDSPMSQGHSGTASIIQSSTPDLSTPQSTKKLSMFSRVMQRAGSDIVESPRTAKKLFRVFQRSSSAETSKH